MGNQKLSKKAIVLAKQKRKKRIRTIVAYGAVTAAVVVSVTLFALAQRQKQLKQTTPLSSVATLGGSRSIANAADHRAVKPVDGIFRFQAADFTGGDAIYYSTKAAGRTVKFFVMQSSDGVIRAAFDACDVCYQAKKGYRQEGSIMVCNNCGQRFPSERINVERGGCNPSPLERHQENGEVLITVADVEKGAMYF